MKDYTVRAKVVVLAASTLESARLLLLSKSRSHANGLANSSGHVGHNFCEHIMGPGVTGRADRKSTRLNSSHSQISYAVFCLKKKRGLRASPRDVCHISYLPRSYTKPHASVRVE